MIDVPPSPDKSEWAKQTALDFLYPYDSRHVPYAVLWDRLTSAGETSHTELACLLIIARMMGRLDSMTKCDPAVEATSGS